MWCLLSAEVKDKNPAGSTLLGEVLISLAELLNAPGMRTDGAQPLTNAGKQTKVC